MPSQLDHALADIAAANDGIITLTNTRQLCMKKAPVDRRVASGAWILVHEGVYRIAGAPVTWRSELRAAAAAAGKGAAISHRAAGASYELPGGRDDLVELSCIRWKRSIKAGLVVHESRRLDERDITTIDDIPFTTPERTVMI